MINTPLGRCIANRTLGSPEQATTYLDREGKLDVLVNKIDSWWAKWLSLGRQMGDYLLSGLCLTHLFCQRPSPLVDIEQHQNGEGAVGILSEAAITPLSKASDALGRKEGVLDLGTRPVFALASLVGLRQRAASVRTLLVKPLPFVAMVLSRSFAAFWRRPFPQQDRP